MNIEVLSRSRFEKFIFETNTRPCIVISISNRGEEPPFIIQTTQNKIQQYITECFNDTDETIAHFGGIDVYQAVEISNFVKTFWHEGIDIVVHCGAGQSRSAGVAAAILKYFTGDDSRIFDNKKYTPNMLCYRRVLGTLMA